MNIKFIIEYKGTNYSGWQIQKNQNTIQGEIKKAFEILFPNQNINIIGSGRTDSGVHAKGQVASLVLKENIELDKIFKSINGIIPNDIYIKKYEEVDLQFNARHSAKYRIYRYYIRTQFSPFNHDIAWHVHNPINYSLLQECANLLKGNHDFSSLSKNNPDIINKKCVIYESFWQKYNNELIYTIKANRFLHHMVRFIVGTSIEVARSKLMTDDFFKMINNSSSKFPMCAPPKGLFLNEVLYD
jgi:tRNA pseudouridine38-40 synthase|tara:strand:- start:218 stop:946 length:729 start_codon:yes stop_codon:yes gene_type:complete